MAVLEQYLCRFGRPLEFYTDKAEYLSHHAETRTHPARGRAFADRHRSDALCRNSASAGLPRILLKPKDGWSASFRNGSRSFGES